MRVLTTLTSGAVLVPDREGEHRVLEALLRLVREPDAQRLAADAGRCGRVVCAEDLDRRQPDLPGARSDAASTTAAGWTLRRVPSTALTESR